jgi:enoyl-CoA hydratase/carnithine racemase
MAYETLLIERRGPVGWLVFNRPEAGNAMDARMLDELEEAWAELDADPDVRVVVTTGEGRAFQTGLDVVQLARQPEALRKQSGRTRRAELAAAALTTVTATVPVTLTLTLTLSLFVTTPTVEVQ